MNDCGKVSPWCHLEKVPIRQTPETPEIQKGFLAQGVHLADAAGPTGGGGTHQEIAPVAMKLAHRPFQNNDSDTLKVWTRLTQVSGRIPDDAKINGQSPFICASSRTSLFVTGHLCFDIDWSLRHWSFVIWLRLKAASW
jgi:hypothetical protein